MILSKLFDFPFSIPRLNSYFDFYGRFIRDSIRKNLNSIENHYCLLDIGAGSQKYRHIVEEFHLKYISCDLPGSYYEELQSFLCDASRLTGRDNEYEFCLQVQVLEHLHTPQLSITEIARVLKPGGKLLLATNFLYPIHGEPDDYYRFTKFGLQKLVENAGMKLVSIEAIGGLFKFLSTSLQFQRDFFFRSKLLFPNKVELKVAITPVRLSINIVFMIAIITLNVVDRFCLLPKFTSGYFVVAEKL